MRPAFVCTLFWLIGHKHQRAVTAEDVFYPTPIPLTEWHPHVFNYERGRAGTLHEVITPATSSDVAVPAHYWEDALKHSVYLTLVRDKIDQLITQDIISHNNDHSSRRERDDRDLWDKIKNAPFDRIAVEEPIMNGDVAVMSKGRLLEDNGRYRFTEDERSDHRCTDERCMEGVKALWSVTRVKQREVETSPGRYHYELTFSVITHGPKFRRKPHENPTRTFTVREMAPETIVDQPLEHRTAEAVPVQKQRSARALWYHKNIVPQQRQQARHFQSHGNPDRLFTSFFMDEYDTQKSYPAPRPPPPPPHQQYSNKVGYVNNPNDNQYYNNKKFTPYIYKPHLSMKYPRPQMQYPPMPQPQHHYLDIDAIGVVSNPYEQTQIDTRYQMPAKPPKTTRPPVLPTPVEMITNKNNFTSTTVNPVTKKYNSMNYTAKPTDEIPAYNKPNEAVQKYGKPKPTPMKISYFTDSIRPPVYNAPPGVFVTMDKKPFKPLPPLKLHSPTRYAKPSKPLDFRPSPQVLDIQFSIPDPLIDGYFRPIAINYTMSNNTDQTETNVANSSEKEEYVVKKHNVTESKNPKTQPKKKSQRITTTITNTTPSSTTKAEMTDYDLSWGNLLGAFTKTTPIDNYTDMYPKIKPSESTVITTTQTPTTTEEIIEELTTTTAASTTQKRTRPPHKFKPKVNKIRKHKRVTSTTTSKPTVVQQKFRKPVVDLTPQASSTATSATRATTRWTPSTTTTTELATSPSTTTTSISTESSILPSSEQHTYIPQMPSKNKNRYRQSTLMYKGTSVKHDKWSVTPSTLDKVNIKTVIPPTGQFLARRTESKFQGYTKAPTQPSYIDDSEDNDYDDHNLTTISEQEKIKTTTESPAVSDEKEEDATTFKNDHERVTVADNDSYHSTSDDYSEDFTNDDNLDEEITAQQSAFFYPKSTTPINVKPNEIKNLEDFTTTDHSLVESSSIESKNKTKCKRKKQKPAPIIVNEEKAETAPTTTEAIVTDIFDELLSAFASEHKTDNSSTRSSADTEKIEENEDLIKDEDFTNFFLNPYESNESGNSDGVTEEVEYSEEDPEYEDDADFVAPRSYGAEEDFESHESEQEKDTNTSSRPYSIFELMAME